MDREQLVESIRELARYMDNLDDVVCASEPDEIVSTLICERIENLTKVAVHNMSEWCKKK